MVLDIPSITGRSLFLAGILGRRPGRYALDRPTAATRVKTTPIRDLRTGMRVIGDNPELADQQIDPLQITDRSRWRNVRLEMSKANGSLLKITLLRPVEWLDFQEAEVGSIIELDLPELGAAGPAQVLAIEPCPEIEPGHRPLITGTFEHTAANVIDLKVESESTPIGTTDNHPFWSEDRQQFVEAGQLRLGETLCLADGRTTRVTSIIPRAGPQTVYNLEVSGEHVYHVGDSGVLVHNTYPNKLAKLTRSQRKRGGFGPSTADRTNRIRASLGAEESRNIAIADVDINGLPRETLQSISGRVDLPGMSPVPVNRRFTTFDVGHTREFDSEVKLLEQIARRRSFANGYRCDTVVF